jgi:hypothetical protein
MHHSCDVPHHRVTQACASLEANYQPKVTFVVVQKRHHTRLFAHNHNDQNSIDRSGNILPGKFWHYLVPCHFTLLILISITAICYLK